MKQLFFNFGHSLTWLNVFLMSLLAVSLPKVSAAHPMPNSVVLLNVNSDRIDAEVQIPLSELQAAFGRAVNDSADHLVTRLGPQLQAYLIRHIRPQSIDGQPWAVSVGTLEVQETQNPINGTYRELIAQVRLVPPAGKDIRRFLFRYDAVLHQVVTHKIMVVVRQDWVQGQVAEDSPAQVGIIELDIINNRILPLLVDLETGSTWTGFRAMVQLGIRHIAEGTDHLLFLLVLLLPAPLLVSNSQWSKFGGVRYSLRRLLLIVTAFTIGHSLTLLLGALDWVRLPSQPVEVLIAVSILVSAAHAVRPLFPGRETWIALGFGLIHGLAFAGTLADLRLDAGKMALSILGFNLGIELMQLFVIVLIVPWLILLSKTPAYKWVRISGALLAAIAALAWIVERSTGKANFITSFVEVAATYGIWLIVALAVVSLVVYITTIFRNRNTKLIS